MKIIKSVVFSVALLFLVTVSAQAQVPLPTEYISVGDYSGTANERIDAAITAAMATNHKTVFFPNGTYALRSGLGLNQGTNTEVHLIGESQEGVQLVPDTAYLEANYNGGDWQNGGARLAHMINLDSTSVFNSVDVSIQNMTIDMRHQLVMGESQQTYNVVGHGVRVGEGWQQGQFTVNHVTIRNVGSYGVGIQDRGGHSKNNMTLTNLNIERTGSDGIDTKEAAGDGNRNLVIRNLRVNEIGFLDTGAANAIDVRYRDAIIENVNLVSQASRSTLPGQTSSNTGINFRPFEAGAAGIVGATVSDVYIRGFKTGIILSANDNTLHQNINVSDFLIEGQKNAGVSTTGTNHSGHTVSDGFVNPDFGGFLNVGSHTAVTNVSNSRWNPALTPTTDTTFESNVSLAGTYSPAWEGIVGSERVSLNPTASGTGPFMFDVGSGQMQIDFDTQFNAMDKLIVDGTLNLNGELQINTIGSGPTLGGTYQIFEADSITGSFDNLVLPSVSGFNWSTENLATNGTISLQEIAPPVISVLNTDWAVTNDNHNSNKPAQSGDFTYNSSTKEYAYSFNAGTDSDMLVVTISVEKSSDPLSVTYDGQALEQAVSSSNGSGASLWYLADPSASGDIVIDASLVGTMNGFGIGLASLSGNGLPMELHTTGVSTGSTSVDITTTVADSFVMVGADANGTVGAPTMNSPLTEIYTQDDVGSSQAGAGYENAVAAGSLTYGWSPNGDERGMVAASFIVITEILAGDYNNDGMVDLADYTVWRNFLGEDRSVLPDGSATSTTGAIDTADYELWKLNFGSSSASATIESAQIPESSSVALLLAGCITGSIYLVTRRTLN